MKVKTSYALRFRNDGTVYRKMISIEMSKKMLANLNEYISENATTYGYIYKDFKFCDGDNYSHIHPTYWLCWWLSDFLPYYQWERVNAHTDDYNTMVRIKLVA